MMYKILSYILQVLLQLADRVEALAERFEPKAPPFSGELHEEYLGWKECGAIHPEHPDVRCIVMVPTTDDGIIIPHFNHAGRIGPVGRMRYIEWIAVSKE